MLWWDSFRGQFDLTCRDRKGGVRWRTGPRNGVTYQGVDRLLDCGFRGVGATVFYAGLIAESGFTAVSVNDTHASHAGWNEWVLYSGSVRPVWQPSAPTGGLMGTLVNFQYVLTSGGQLRGAFLASSSAQDANPASILYCTAVGSSPFTFLNGDTVTGSYFVRLGV